MLTRRTFLNGAACASALRPLPGRAGPDADWNAHRVEVAAHLEVVVDRRFAPSAVLAECARRAGVRVHAVEDDLSALWHAQLDALWRRPAIVTAGLTTYGPRFCVEQLARGYDMRLIYAGEHQPIGALGAVEHRLRGPTSMVERAGGFATRDFALCLVEIWSAPIATKAYRRTIEWTVRSSEAGMGGTLHSWLIVPRRLV